MIGTQKLRRLTYLTATIILCLAGCAQLGTSFDTPNVTLADIQVNSIKTLETAFLVQLRVTNPNDVPLDIQGLNCAIELNGKHFASGVQGDKYTIEPYSSTLLPVEVYASVLDMVYSVVDLLQSANSPDSGLNNLEYRVQGKLRISTTGLTRNIPFDSSGELKLQ